MMQEENFARGSDQPQNWQPPQDFGQWNNFGKPADWQPDQNWQPPQNFDGGFNQGNFNQPQNWQNSGFQAAPATDASGFTFAAHDVSPDQSPQQVTDSSSFDVSHDNSIDGNPSPSDENANNQANS